MFRTSKYLVSFLFTRFQYYYTLSNEPLLLQLKMNKKLKLWELDRLSVEEFKQVEKLPITVVLDDIRSLNNVGAFFRTADSFKVERIILCGITPQPPHREIQKTALGATESVEWKYAENVDEVILELKKEDYVICSIEQAEDTLSLENVCELPNAHYALVFGNEVNGVSQNVIDMSDHVVEIPQFGTKHSLNVSVCAGIVMWEFAKKWIK